MKPCSNCNIARDNPHYKIYAPACLWCGVRIIQQAKDFNLLPVIVAERRKANLAAWVAHGHSEAEIRAMVPGPIALAPIGQAKPSEFVASLSRRNRAQLAGSRNRAEGDFAMTLIREILSIPLFLAAGALICAGIVIGFVAGLIDGDEK